MFFFVKHWGNNLRICGCLKDHYLLTVKPNEMLNFLHNILRVFITDMLVVLTCFFLLFFSNSNSNYKYKMLRNLCYNSSDIKEKGRISVEINVVFSSFSFKYIFLTKPLAARIKRLNVTKEVWKKVLKKNHENVNFCPSLHFPW